MGHMIPLTSIGQGTFFSPESRFHLRVQVHAFILVQLYRSRPRKSVTSCSSASWATFCAWPERKRHKHQGGLSWLTEHIELERWAWQQLEKEWGGGAVRLKEDIRSPNDPEGLQVYVQAGTKGKIVALNRDKRAPFTVLFPGFAHKVVVRLKKLDLNATDSLIEEYGVA